MNSNSADRGTTPVRFGVIGHPIAHSLSPALHNAAFRALGMAPTYEAFDVDPSSLEAFLRGLAPGGFGGINVTLPHKEAVLRLVERPTERAMAVGAVNTVTLLDGELEGDNTDVIGFLAPLHEATSRHGVQVREAVVLGAGGAARAVVYGLLLSPMPVRIVLLSRRPEQARSLAEALAGTVPSHAAIHPGQLDDAALHAASADLVVNTTPVGMVPRDGVSPCPPDIFRPGQIAYDLVYRPLRTRFLQDAAARGAFTVGGLPMLVEQAAAAFSRWTGLEMPREVARDAAESALDRP